MHHTERFAPSPTGPLHLGHAYSAITAWDAAHSANGTFHMRIEDIDQTRARPKWEDLIYEDLHWLGLSWEQPVLRQSDRMEVYQAPFKAFGQKACSTLATATVATSKPPAKPPKKARPCTARTA